MATTQAERTRAIHRMLIPKHPQLRLGLVEEIVRRLMELERDELVQTGELRVHNFGSFHAIERPPRAGRDPRTGEKRTWPAKRVARFRAARHLQALLSPAPGRGATRPAAKTTRPAAKRPRARRAS